MFFSSILKNANVLPRWVELRQEIVAELKDIIVKIDLLEDQVSDDALATVNQKIREYNTKVPNMHLQKGLVSIQSIKTQYEKWL